jgi:hypothetical protein
MDRVRPGLLACLPLTLLLGGCFGDIDLAPFGRTDPIGAPDSLTTQRVMGTVDEVPPLLPEPGNVWPAEEAPRATLLNPDAAAPLRDPAATPLDRARQRGRPPEPALESARPGPDTPEGDASRRQPRLRRQGSSEALPPLDPPPLPRHGVPRGAPPTPPEPRLEGQVLPVPGGPPATITGGSGRVQSYTQPGVGTGTAIREGGTTTLIGPDGSIQVVPNPR